jgi:hypothetical protein
VIGSIRRECLDHIVIFNELHLRRVLSSYVDHYQRSRTHLSLDKDCPQFRPIQHGSVGRGRRHPKNRWLASSLRTSHRLICSGFLLTNGCAPARSPVSQDLSEDKYWEFFDLNQAWSACGSDRSPSH